MSSNQEEESKFSFRGLMKKLDYFAITFEFRVDNKPKYGSVTGGVWFLIYIIFALAFFIKRCFDYLSWSDTKIQFIEKALDPGPSLNFKKMNFTYAVRVTFDNDTSLVNTSLADLFIMEHNYVSAKDGEKKKKIKSLPRSCLDSDFYNHSNDYTIFKRQPIGDFDCFDFYENFTLKGIYTDPEMSYSEILLSLNPKYFEDYKKLEDIFSDNQFKFTLYYVDTFNDVSNYIKPVFYKVDAIYTYLDLQNFKRNNINFQQFINTVDNNLFYNKYESKTYMKIHSSQEIPAPILNRSLSSLDERYYLNKFFLRAVNDTKEVKLSFIKIPEFLATLSGLLVNMLVILAILMKALNTFEAKQSVMSKIMKYKDVIKANHRKSLNYLSNKFKDHSFLERRSSKSLQKSTESNENEQNHVNRISKSENIIEIGGNAEIQGSGKSNDSKINFNKERLLSEEWSINKDMESERKQTRNPYIIKLSDICCFIFCCKSIQKKQKIFKNAERKFNNNIDLVTFMKKMQEVEILKYLLLDKDSLKLMNFISKPCISLSNAKIEDEEYNEFFEKMEDSNNMSNQDVDSVKKSYDRIISKSYMTYTENRIIKLFDLQIQEIIQ